MDILSHLSLYRLNRRATLLVKSHMNNLYAASLDVNDSLFQKVPGIPAAYHLEVLRPRGNYRPPIRSKKHQSPWKLTLDIASSEKRKNSTQVMIQAILREYLDHFQLTPCLLSPTHNCMAFPTQKFIPLCYILYMNFCGSFYYTSLQVNYIYKLKLIFQLYKALNVKKVPLY